MEYQASPFNSNTVKVFKVSSQTDIQLINPVSYTNGVVKFQDISNLSNIKDYYVVGDNGYKTPVSISGKIANQNIKEIPMAQILLSSHLMISSQRQTD